MSEIRTLVDLIETRKAEEEKGITFILNDTEERFISYNQMFKTSLKLLAVFQKFGFKPKDEVIFQIEDNEQFVYSFWACVLGGMIPVPVPCGDNDEHKSKLFKIWNILRNPKILILDKLLKTLEAFARENGLDGKLESIKNNSICIDKINPEDEEFGEIYNPKPENIAFIQFSSGSTGDPKGVMITHSNVFVNLTSILKWDHYTLNDASLSWLPLTHDMGLIGFHIKEVLANINQYSMPTQLFLTKPLLWLQKVSEHKATVLYSPNFGYKQVLKMYNPDAKLDWDLSSVRIIYNGAEPTSLDVNNEFIAKMSVYGLKRSAMRPVYGLAESTIAVAFPKIDEEDFIYHALDRNHLRVGETVADTTKDDINAVIYLDVGYPIYNTFVRITDENDKNIGENKIGYVQIKGGNVTSGYYNNKKATQETITADGWLNTGDLGFLRDKRLTITGRAKDVIFAAGQNFYSHDIERIGERVDGIELGSIAAAGVYNDRLNCDELVLFVKYSGKLDSFINIISNLKKEITQKNGIDVSEVIPIKEIPKTSSGKVQRFKLRENYINGEYDSVKQQLHALMNEKFSRREIVKPATPTQKELSKIWSEILSKDKIGIKDDFFELGGDSLKVTQIISRVRDCFKIELNQVEIFENPTIENLASIIDSNVKKENDEEKITPVTKGLDKTQLSYAQQRLWFLDRLNLNSPQYNLTKGLILKGGLNIGALKKSFNAIIRRHKILNAYFAEENGQPVEMFGQDIEMPLKLTDLSSVSEKDRKDKVTELAKNEARTPFDLEKAPLIRGNLICLSETEHILILSVHHIVFDGWSFGILLRELNFYYEGYLNGNKKSLPELKIQYADFSLWQKHNIEDARLKNQLKYWTKKLEGNLPVLDLPLDKQRPAIQTYNGAKFTSFIPARLVDKLQKYAKSENATLFMVLLSAFKVLLYKYSGQTDIIVGSPIANRDIKDIEDLIGFFTNNIVLRTSFSNNFKFNELLQKVKQTTVEAYSNQDIPFEKIVEQLRIERDMSKNPIFQVLFGMQNTPMPAMEMPGLDVSILDVDGGYSRFDLSVDIQNAGDGLAANFEYNTDLLSGDTITRMAGHFNKLLSGIAENPSLSLDDYEILTDEEKKTILDDWNGTKENLPEVSSWTQLFEKQAAQTPNALAVVCGNQQMTYKELDESSNKVAHYLKSCGVGAESIVGVYIDRSVNMLVGLIGVQKAGAAYLPMDPIYPKERLAYMLQDADIKTILSEKKLSETLPENNATVICLDSDGDKISQCSAEKTALKKSSKNLAYVIYTSGSTGKPKGVQIKQHALINLLLSFAKKTDMRDSDTLLAVTTLSFDIAGLELYMPLIRGAKVVIAQRDDVTDGEKLISMMKQYGVTIMQATPATWRLLLDAGWTGSEKLKVLCGGETLPKDLANELLERCSALLNVYGPTETTIWSTMDVVEKGSDTIYIGKPIANTQVYVVDKSMNPVPIGVPGELLIGGDGLASGYMNLPKLTKEKFIPDKFSKKRGALLYRTGDVVKFTSSGKLECIGRMDHQVKIRGFRIELGEIESLINSEQFVKQGIVVAKELVAGEKSLVAYIIPSSKIIDTERIRRNLKEKLPNYMVPSAFMVMDSFPMTPNGKIDRKALPLPERTGAKNNYNFIDSSNDDERKLQEIWKEVLKLDQVDVNSNFFDLGGHSLLMAQVRSKIRSKLKKEISMLDLFKYPTISSLAAYLSGNNKAENEAASAKKQINKAQSSKIAIIGLSGKFPGAKNLDEFWKNLCNGVNSISHFTDQQVIAEGVNPEMVKKPGYVKAWGTLDDIDLFDAQFFGYNPREAEVLDPQQRIFLEESWKALEDAGYDTDKIKGSVGVFGSVGRNTYAKNLEDDSKGLANDYQIMISNDKDFLATRIGYKLNLEGPCLTVQTACSSSLVAVHLACQSLLNGECDMALAGGVSVKIPQNSGYLYQEGMILSPDGNCRAFDEKAKGTVGGNGAGVVILKRYEDAVADGDNISAVILGTAVNNDGSLKIGYTAPSIGGQSKAIAKAQENAGIDPETISYIEAHGTGTPLGDPIEIEALTQVFREKTDRKEFCGIGSVKTNIGHLDAAAGIAGLIKTVLALRHKMIPPTLNFTTPNPKIDFKESPFFVNKSLTEWKDEKNPLRAGVSAFGIGGTNAHVILEEAPILLSDASEEKPLLFTLSAKTKKALDNMTANLLNFLENNSKVNLADVAYTLQMGRKEFNFRRFFVSSSIEETMKTLKDTQNVFDGIGEKFGGNRKEINDPEDYPLNKLGQMWIGGAKINWQNLYKNQRRKRVSLPVYPFERQSFFVKKNVHTNTLTPISNNKKAGISEWFYTPIWKQSVDCGDYDADTYDYSKEILLILKDSSEFSDTFEVKLRKRGANLVVAVSGKEYKKYGADKYIFDPENPEHYDMLIGELANSGKMPVRIANLLGIGKTENCLHYGERLFYSMMYLAQAIGKNDISAPIELKAFTSNSQRICCESNLIPENVLHLGACRVIPTEYPNIKCCSVDSTLPETGSIKEEELIDLFIDELYFMPCDGVAAYRGMERWKQFFEKLPVKNNNRGIKLKNDGVYVITGGIGGIGLVTAKLISNEVKGAKLALVGRSEFPEKEQWDSYIRTHGKRNRISQKIMLLKEIASTGAEVCIFKADVTDKESLVNIRRAVTGKFGKISGIIHAAGKPGGGMIQMKKKEQAEEVLKPKVYGTINLYNVFKDCNLDFMLFYSSLNAITGGFGQIDYSAANAFMDAFAQVHDGKSNTRFIAIDWDRWPGTGMANGSAQADSQTVVHPLLGKCILDKDDKVVYESELSPEKDFVLSEHLVLGIPTIAGTTYLEMARAAFEDITGNSNAQISEVLFLKPLAVKVGEKRDVYTVLSKKGDAYEFEIISKDSGEEVDNANFLEHIHGKISPSANRSGAAFDLDDLKKKYGLKTIYSEDGQHSISEKFISFGGRWRSLKSFTLSESAGLTEVRLNNAYLNDLETYKLHPALLDTATGALRLTTKGNYLPFSYEKLEIYNTLPQKIYSLIKFKSGVDSTSEIISCDIDIIDENGNELIKITNFSMKRVNDATAENIRKSTSSVSDSAGIKLVFNLLQNKNKGFLQEGIAVNEGIEALRIIMKGCFKPQVTVSTKDIKIAMSEANYIAQASVKNTIMEVAATKARHPRPELENEYVAPKNETEKKLALIWQDVLSIDNVGIYDEFFALGGDSLLLIQLHTKLKEYFETEIAVVDLYKYNTIALLAKYLTGGKSEDEQPKFDEVNDRVSRQKELMKKRRGQMLRRRGANLR